MEFGLVRLLLERRRQQQNDPEFAYVAWHEIADALTFRSIETDAENVRELVARCAPEAPARAVSSRASVASVTASRRCPGDVAIMTDEAMETSTTDDA